MNCAPDLTGVQSLCQHPSQASSHGFQVLYVLGPGPLLFLASFGGLQNPCDPRVPNFTQSPRTHLFLCDFSLSVSSDQTT